MAISNPSPKPPKGRKDPFIEKFEVESVLAPQIVQQAVEQQHVGAGRERQE